MSSQDTHTIAVPEDKYIISGETTCDCNFSNQKNPHLTIVVRFKNGDNPEDFTSEIFSEFVAKFHLNINHTIIDKTCEETKTEINNILNTKCHETIQSLWLVFIGPATADGLVTTDNYYLPIDEILAMKKQENSRTFISIFAYPHHGIDVTDYESVTNLSNLSQLSESNNLRIFEDIESLQKNIERQIFDKLEASTNYYLSLIPLSIVGRKENKLILKCFTDHFDVSVVGNIDFTKTTLETILRDLKKLPLHESPLPVYRCN